jgi:predicted nucleotidyltransferase
VPGARRSKPRGLSLCGSECVGARHKATAIAVFGSVARGEDGPDSDVDLLVDFERGSTLGDVYYLQKELEELLYIFWRQLSSCRRWLCKVGAKARINFIKVNAETAFVLPRLCP